MEGVEGLFRFPISVCAGLGAGLFQQREGFGAALDCPWFHAIGAVSYLMPGDHTELCVGQRQEHVVGCERGVIPRRSDGGQGGGETQLAG